MNAGNWVCPICGVGQVRERVAEVIWRMPVPGPRKYEIVRCRDCEVVAADPMPSREILDAYYSHYEPTIIDSFRSARLVQLQSRLWRYLRSRLPPDNAVPRVLDFGFGAGAFIKFVALHGASAFGADFSHQNIQQLAFWCSENNVAIRTANVGRQSLAELGEGAMDLITMFQVVEHLVSPVAVIRDLTMLQSRGGLLYIECPNQDAWFFRAKNVFRKLLSREFMYGSVSPPQHVLGFNVRSLRRLLDVSGYEVIEIRDYAVADGVHAPETVDWYPTPWEWLVNREKRTLLGMGKVVIRLIDRPASRVFRKGGGLFALARKRA